MSRLLAAGEVLQEATADLPFNLGDSVEFTSGPFAGRRGLVQQCAHDRVEVLLTLLGGQVPVKVSPAALRYVMA
jgi:transcription antitermination factor NusG